MTLALAEACDESTDKIFACELNFKADEEIRDPDLIQIQTDIDRNWKQFRGKGGLLVAEAILQSLKEAP